MTRKPSAVNSRIGKNSCNKRLRLKKKFPAPEDRCKLPNRTPHSLANFREGHRRVLNISDLDAGLAMELRPQAGCRWRSTGKPLATPARENFV
jgi:hypothetical protein